MCVDMLVDMSIDMAPADDSSGGRAHACRHVYGRVYRHVYGHAYGGVYRHVHRHVYRHVYPAWRRGNREFPSHVVFFLVPESCSFVLRQLEGWGITHVAGHACRHASTRHAWIEMCADVRTDMCISMCVPRFQRLGDRPFRP